MSGEDEREDEGPIEGFTWGGMGPPLLGETDVQQKHQHVQEALFDELYKFFNYNTVTTWT
jgi:hypothetical protein